jgi:hypothetical protein
VVDDRAVRFDDCMPTDGPLPASLFLLVDPGSARALLPSLHAHFRREPRITVLVERRAAAAYRAGSRPLSQPHRRAPVAERDVERALPRELRHAVGHLRLVQRMPPVGRTHEDSDLDALVAAAVALDPAATAELWWRVAPRVLPRLALRIGDAAATAAVPALLGRTLDELTAYEPARDSLAGWLDATVDRHAETIERDGGVFTVRGRPQLIEQR